jgi:two-component system chemotaxis sensor kinase CheA
MSKDNDFLKRLLATFKIEADEHIRAISSGLIELEHATDPKRQTEIIEAVFREAHSLKGAARAVNMTEIETICQAVEGVFSSLKKKEISFSPDLSTIIYKATDNIEKILLTPQEKRHEETSSRELIQQLEGVSKGALHLQEVKPTEVQEAFFVQKPTPTETIRISKTKLDSIFVQTEELLSAKQVARQRVEELREMKAKLADWEKGRRTSRLPTSEFWEGQADFIQSHLHNLAAMERSAEQDLYALSTMVDNLLEEVKKVLMFPFSSLLEIFPRFVRDLSLDRGKEVELVIRGTEIEIDRRILEEMKDPLIHLVRNCVDHGIEKPEERERKGKTRGGMIVITVSQKSGGKVEVSVFDDGAGIDLNEVKRSALKLGILSEEEAANLNDQKALSLIFQSGVTTSSMITDISGRGLGLVIVQEKVEKLGGTVSVETNGHKGTTFRLLLPLTVATFRGILVRVGESLFVLPTMSVESVLRLNGEEIKTVENRETIQFDGQAVSFVRLGEVLGLGTSALPRSGKGNKRESGKGPVVVLGSRGKRMAFSVDEVISEQEVLLKDLGKQLVRVKNILGATVLGTGRVVPVLNVSNLMKSAIEVSTAPAEAIVPLIEEEARKKSILVVEDSITARTLLKNILESAGYEVRTAFDGKDAVTALRTEAFDLVVSDVDMPRMNGFNLTENIRADKKLSELPVVLVTALESREDRERGVEVGANAYIVKSSFDQSNLLEVIGRLI